MKKQEKYKALIDYFSQQMPDAQTELHYTNPFELLIAVMLSAQCTDKRVNMVTPILFKKFPNVKALANASFEDVFECIKSISYPNNKSKFLIATANIINDKYQGNIPQSVDELVQLPGVGRKTANVITSVLFEQPNMAVDTHVFRVSQRIGIVNKNSSILSTEKQLVKHFPQHLIHKAHHWLILHGRYVCEARKPKCNECKITHLCNFYKHPSL